METGLMLLYDALLVLVLLVGSPYWLLRIIGSGRYRAGLAQRLGAVPRSLRHAVRAREVVWLHAVSVGEVMAAIPVVQRLLDLRPGLLVAVSTTTETGQQLARRRLSHLPVFYLPLDLRYAVRRYLKALQPRILILMESELWPNLLRECGRSGVSVAIINARVSDRSFPRYMRLRRLWKPLLERVTIFLAQGRETADRLMAIGVRPERLRVTGNLKFDIKASSSGAVVDQLRTRVPEGARVVVCGSTLEGEEALLVAAWPSILVVEPGALLVLAPRHPDRFARVAELVQATGRPVWRASALTDVERFSSGDVILLDTVGDLASVYSLAALAFVGGTLVTAGGHNPLEPAQFGVPVVIGSSFNNFREIVERMQASDGIRVTSSEQLSGTLCDLLRDRAGGLALGRRGEAVFAAEAGATERTVEELLRLLDSKGEPSQR